MNPQFLRQRHNVVAALEPLHRHPTELLRMPSRSFLGHLQSPSPAKCASSVCLKIGVHSTSACVVLIRAGRWQKRTDGSLCHQKRPCVASEFYTENCRAGIYPCALVKNVG